MSAQLHYIMVNYASNIGLKMDLIWRFKKRTILHKYMMNYIKNSNLFRECNDCKKMNSSCNSRSSSACSSCILYDNACCEKSVCMNGCIVNCEKCYSKIKFDKTLYDYKLPIRCSHCKKVNILNQDWYGRSPWEACDYYDSGYNIKKDYKDYMRDL